MELGFVKESPMRSAYSLRWDQQEDFRPEPEKDDDSLCIGEDTKGIWSCVHPTSLLIAHEMLWDIYTDWQFGAREVSDIDRETKSNFELEGSLTLAAASSREEMRRIKEAREDG